MATTVKTKSATVRNIQLADIQPSSLNPRKTFDQKSLNELADSIKEKGLIQPIVLRKTPKGSEKKYEIVCGERRFRASVIAGNSDIQAIVKELDDTQAFAAMIIENLQRKDVDPIEEASALKTLAEKSNMKPADIAKTIGKSVTYVTSHMRLANVIPEFVQLMHDKVIFLFDLLELSKLTPKQQKILYDKRFTPEKLEKYKSEQYTPYGVAHVAQSVYSKWIDEDVMNYLDMARFSLNDESFTCGHNCVGCPLNTKNRDDFKDKRYRCLDPECFETKTEEQVFREAKKYDGRVIFKGKGNDKYLDKAKEYGISVEDYTDHQYVLEPHHPEKDNMTDDAYEQKMHTYNHVKAILDSNIADGTVEHVFELCFNGVLSGAEKMAYSIPKDLNGKTVAAVENSKANISKAKENILKYKEEAEARIIDDERIAFGESAYSSLNTVLSGMEQKIFHAVILKHLSYTFKKSLGLTWTNSEEAFKNGQDIIEKNRNAIKREFIKTMLSEESVNYSHDLAGMLKAIMGEQFPDDVERITTDAYSTRDKKIDGMKKWIDELKAETSDGQPTEEQPSEQPTDEVQPEAEETPAVEQPAEQAPQSEEVPPVEETSEEAAETEVEETPTDEQSAEEPVEQEVEVPSAEG